MFTYSFQYAQPYVGATQQCDPVFERKTGMLEAEDNDGFLQKLADFLSDGRITADGKVHKRTIVLGTLKRMCDERLSFEILPGNRLALDEPGGTRIICLD